MSHGDDAPPGMKNFICLPPRTPPAEPLDEIAEA